MAIKFSVSSETAERPLELLYACHDKVRHFSGLVAQLVPHVAQKGADAEAQLAASNTLRYFELALPLHHADEEEDIFPALRELHELELTTALDVVVAEHVVLDRLWQSVRPWLNQIVQGLTPTHTPLALAEFARAYPEHTAFEENEIFNAIQRLRAEQIDSIARRMRQRRGAAL